MRLHIATLIVASTCLTPAWALDLKTASRIDAVTVYPQGAEITRIAEASLAAGEHTLILEDLPGELDPQSIRVEGEAQGAVEIGSVDSKIVYLPTGSTDAERRRIERDIEALQDERQALDQTIADADYQKRLLLSLADKQLVPASKDDAVRPIDAVQLGGLVDLVSLKLAEISKTIHAARIRQRAIDKLTYDWQAKLAGLAPNQVARMRVSVHLATPAAVAGVFKVRYRVGNAGWLPFYDARLGPLAKDGKAPIELVRRAEVMQSTAESWDGVALTLSTARTLGATTAPDLWEQLVTVRAARADAEKLAKAREALPMAAPELQADAVGASPPPAGSVRQTQASIEIAGFQALYGIQGRVTVDNSGTAKKVRIGTDAYDATLDAVTVPKLDPAAYLTAAFTVKSEAPILPGAVNLYRDGVFMGQGALPLLNAGEAAELGFGADDLIKVERVEVRHKTGEEGLITTSHVDERQWEIAVENLHTTAIPVTVIDQLPFSTDTAVTVEPMPGMTPPTEKAFEKRRGVLAWRFTAEPKAEQTIRFGYKITWPQDVEVGLND